MVLQQIRPWGVHDERVLALMASLPREEFVPLHWRNLAFADTPLPLLADAAAARDAGQVMLPPCMQARMAQELNIAPHEKVLHIGTGSGFMAALLGGLAQRVISAELDETLAQRAQENLARTGTLNVHVRAADGLKVALEDGPFDAILLSGSVLAVPDALIYQLSASGRLLAIVGDEYAMRATLLRRTTGGANTIQPWDATAPRLRGHLAANAAVVDGLALPEEATIPQ